MWDVMLPDHDLNVHAEIVRPSQDLDHAPHRVFAVFRELDNLHVDDHPIQIFRRLHLHRRHAHPIAALCSLGQLHAFRNLDPLADPLVMRRHEIPALANAKLAHHGLMRAAQHLHDLAVGAPIPFDARDANHHAIAVHRGLRRFARDVNVPAQAFDRMVGNQKPVAVAVHVQPARRRIRG